ncbi:MAG: ABC transporter permease [Thermomicrobiales bacterium]|jgi:ABC transporter DrrB family efflux protein|nr:ABC transporter permease [Thermomicrobiales bacterium]
MSAIATPRSSSANSFRQAVSDGLVVAWRNLKRVPRIPELAIFAIIQSIMFVLLFAFVFGGAIPLPDGGSYREFLMPGIFAQTVAFASAITAIGMTEDVKKGIIDRFRSMPMSRSAVLSGRAIFDLVYQSFIVLVLMISGFAVGWRVHGTVLEFFAGVGLLLLFTFAMSWVGIWMGLYMKTVETAQQMGFTIIFPLTFVSNVFVPPETMPSWLQPVAKWNPVSTLTAATRDLWGNPNPYASQGFPAEHPALLTIIWIVIMVAIFGPLGVRKYRSLSN